MSEMNTTGLVANGLVGRWVLFPDPDNVEYCQTGQIALSIGDHHHLVRMRPPTNGVPPSSRLVTSDALTADDISIFDTSAELEAWLGWEPDDDKPRVVAMIRPKTK